MTIVGTAACGRGDTANDSSSRVGPRRGRAAIPARARRRSGRRAGVCRRIRGPSAEGKDAHLASVPGGARGPRHLLRPEVRAQSRDARRARGDRHARRRRSMPTLDEITRYTKLFWINSGPYNNLTARKFVLQCTPDAFAAAAHAAEQAGATLPAEAGRNARSAARAAAADVLRSERRSDRDEQDAAGRQGHPHRQREQSVRRRDDEGSRGLSGAVSAQFAAGEERRQDRRRGLPRRRALRRPDRGHRQAPRGRHSVCDRADGGGACAR